MKSTFFIISKISENFGCRVGSPPMREMEDFLSSFKNRIHFKIFYGHVLLILINDVVSKTIFTIQITVIVNHYIHEFNFESPRKRDF